MTATVEITLDGGRKVNLINGPEATHTETHHKARINAEMADDETLHLQVIGLVDLIGPEERNAMVVIRHNGTITYKGPGRVLAIHESALLCCGEEPQRLQ